MKSGMVIAYTGEGKGKTTAALGLAFRALGYGKKIKIVQFIKGKKQTGERLLASKINGIEIESTGLGFVGIQKDTISLAKHRKGAQNALERVERAVRGGWGIIILDEVFVAIKLHLIEEDRIVEILRKRSEDQTIVLTGRGASKNIIKHCDLVTTMEKVKHPFDKGLAALESIDY